MYRIFYKDIPVFEIDTEKSKGIVKIFNEKYLPFDIYVEESEDIDDRLNNLVNFNEWCAKRVLPLDREYAKEILNFYGFTQGVTDAERAKIAIECRCLSLNDCFWLKDPEENVTWKDVNLFENSLKNAVFEIALFGETPTITNKELSTFDITTNGKAPKAWQRLDNEFYLLKGDKNDSVDKETEASAILREFGFNNVSYIKEYFKNRPVSKCKCFTDEKNNFVKAEWFNIWCMNKDLSISDFIEEYRLKFDMMNLADYIIGNNDEHAHNWGFIYDNDMQIISITPHMDFDHAFESSPASICQPMRFLGINTTQFDEALNIVKKHPDWISKEIDLSKYKYGDFVKERLEMLKKNLTLIPLDSGEEYSGDDMDEI